jgi:hypothetical protein
MATLDNSINTITWNCDICDGPIADEDGYLCVSYGQINKYRDDVRIWEEKHPDGLYSLASLVGYPPAVPWSVLHRRCDPQLEGTDYWISVERINTPGDVIAWTAHLMQKRWLSWTTWTEILSSVASNLGGSL